MSPPDGVLDYERTRYTHVDQMIVNKLEHRALQRLLVRAGLRGGALLNVPCGYGRFTRMLAGLGDALYYLDLHPQMVRRSRERHAADVAGFVNGSMRALPFRDNAFEMVVTVRFFHHFFDTDDRRGMLRELSRVSARHVLLTYYRPTRLHALTKRLNPKGHRIVMLDRDGFRNELRAAGLEPLKECALMPLVHAQRFVLCAKTR
jgi:ubiquinone/menaquinone biosynthesis C-methylase UbiE